MQRSIHFRGNKKHPHGSPTIREFVLDRTSDVKLIEGPIESGKTTGAIGDLYLEMCLMPRCLDGIRRSRMLIVRPTYGELHETVVKDWLEWFPEAEYGTYRASEPSTYNMKFEDVECQVVFMALLDAKKETLRKLRSTQFTKAWVNEGQYCPLQLFTEIIDRCGRYPSKSMCPDWDRVKRAILDNNAPPTHHHWIRFMRGDVPLPADMPDDQKMAYKKPAGWKFYRQPAAVIEVKKPGTGELLGYKINPVAENLQWQGEAAYLGNIGGKPRDQIDRDYRNVTRPSRSGTPRYPGFDREFHVSTEKLVANDGHPLILSFDFGMTPACMFEQRIDGCWYTLWEHVATNEDAEELAENVKVILGARFPFHRETGISAFGDPQGGWKGSNRRATSFSILESIAGIIVKAPAKKDNPELRMNIGRRLLRESNNRRPKVLIDPRCVRLIEAMDGGCKMKQVVTGDSISVKEEIIKDAYSHPVEAWEYDKWGFGEGKDLVTRAAGAERRGKVTKTLANKPGFGAEGRTWAAVSRR